ncbi:MAG: cytochrome c5 family protein [Acidiferrobacterales bacterium]
MAEKRFAKNVLIISVVSAVLTLFIYILVAHHRDTPNRVRQDRNAQLGAGSGVAEQTKPVGQIKVAAAEPQRDFIQVAAAAPVKVNGQQVYQSICVACHGAGIAGAPKLGDASQWAKRIAKGLDILYASAINGVQGSAGVMPAKGGNPALSDAEVKAAVDYMVAQSK